MEAKEYFEKVMQDYNQRRNGRSLRKYFKDEGVDYAWLIEYRTGYYIGSCPTDIRKGRGGLARIVREAMKRNPLCYDEAFIFYSKDYKKVKLIMSRKRKNRLLLQKK